MRRVLVSCAIPAALLAALTSPACSKSAGRNPAAPTGFLPSTSLSVIVDNSSLTSSTAGYGKTWNWAGQSVTIPQGTYDNIRFCWLGVSTDATISPAMQQQPAAFGTLYLLDREYLGLPADLVSAPGLIARSETNIDGQYAFRPEVKLAGGRQYWFYTDTQGSFVSGFSEDTYPGGDLYLTGYKLNPFSKAPASWRVIDLGPPIVYYKPPPGTHVDANFKGLGTTAQ